MLLGAGDDDDDRPVIGHNSHNSMSGGLRMSEMGQPGSAGGRIPQFSSHPQGSLQQQQQQQHHHHQQQQQQQQLNNLQAQRRGAPTMPRLPSSQRLPENINQTHRPTDKSSSRQPAAVNPRQLPPPTGLPPTSSSLRPHHASPQGGGIAHRSGSSPGLQLPSAFGVPDVAMHSSISGRLKQVGKSLPKLSSVPVSIYHFNPIQRFLILPMMLLIEGKRVLNRLPDLILQCRDTPIQTDPGVFILNRKSPAA